MRRSCGRGRAELDGGVAQPALGHVDDALEGEVVGRRVDDAQIGQRVADLGALVEPRAADHPVGQAERDEAVFELAHLERGAHQDGDLVEDMAAALQLLDLLADRAGLFLAVPRAGDGDLLARHVLGAQRLAEPALVVRDQMARCRQDVPGASVIPLQPDDLRARKVVIEAEDVIHLRAAPAVDRLVVVADAADVFLRGRLPRHSRPRPCETLGLRPRSLGVRVWVRRTPAPSRCTARSLCTLILTAPRAAHGVSERTRPAALGAALLRNQPQPEILRHVGVLVLVHQDEPEPLLILPQHVGLLAEQPDVLQQQVAEVGGVERLEPLLIRRIELLAAAVGEARGLAGRHQVGRQPAVLPVVDQRRRTPAPASASRRCSRPRAAA